MPKKPASPPAAEKDPRFEDALARLEKTVERLESGELDLEESLKLFEEGVALSRICRAKLDEVQKRIEVLTETAAGTLKLEPLHEDE